MFLNIKKRKDLIDQELALYRSQEMVKIANQVLEERTYVAEMKEKCAKQLGELEHDFHYAVEEKKVKIAKLEAKVEDLENTVELKEAYLIKLKVAFSEANGCREEHIGDLKKIINNLTDKIKPEVKVVLKEDNGS